MEGNEDIEQKESETEVTEKEISDKERIASLEEECLQLRDKYLRFYAEFENYKKRVQKEKEELVKYGNESLLYEILSVLDNLEMALKHSTNSVSDGLVKGVEITLREFLRITEKFGMTVIPALGRAFDPAVHHAMSQVERDDLEDNTVAEEFRKGFMLEDKVLRPSLVLVSKKSSVQVETENKTNDKGSKEE